MCLRQAGRAFPTEFGGSILCHRPARVPAEITLQPVVGTTLMPQCCSVTLLYQCTQPGLVSMSHPEPGQLRSNHFAHAMIYNACRRRRSTFNMSPKRLTSRQRTSGIGSACIAGAVHRCELSHRGRSSRTYQHTKAMMHAEPQLCMT